MARVTVEDCIDKVDSPYELVLVAKERATQLNSGIEPSVERDNDKNTVIALREIANENVKTSDKMMFSNKMPKKQTGGKLNAYFETMLDAKGKKGSPKIAKIDEI